MKYLFITLLLSNVAFSFCEGNPSQNICASEHRNFELVNEYRQSKGVGDLELSVYLSYVARDWSEKMAGRGRISHSGFPGLRRKLLSEMFPFLIAPRVSRENVAMFSHGNPLSKDAGETFHRMWITSAGHAANMRASDVIAIGVGIYQSGSSYYGTQIFGSDGVFFNP